LNQTYKEFELLILDDNSTDDSRKIIGEYVTKHPEIKTYFNDSNSGNPFIQWNRGVDLSKGEYIWIAESDDYAEPEFLEKTVQVLAEDQNTGLVFTDSRIINEQKGIEYLASERRKVFSNDRLEGCFNDTKGRTKSMRPLLENPIVNVSSVLFRRSKLADAGGVDPSMKFCGDWLTYIRIFLISDIQYIREPLNTFRLHSLSTFHLFYQNNIFLREKLKIYSYLIKYIKSSPVTLLLVFIKIMKALIIRLIFILGIDTILIPELPRPPKTKKPFIFFLLSFIFYLIPCRIWLL